MKISEKHRSSAIGVLLAACLVVCALLLTSSALLQRLDHVLYDAMLPLQSSEISEQITIVSIDEHSIQQLGRWPWSRRQHAGLLNILDKMGARAIGMDILFTESQLDDPDADIALAGAIKKNRRTVLIVAPSQQQGNELITELMPLPELAGSAAALAHVDVELDADGLCRRTYLMGGINDARWPSLALALLQVGGDDFPLENTDQTLPEKGGWLRRHEMMIPFASLNSNLRHVSYSDLVQGDVADSDIRDKYVLVGATAHGLGDLISTPGAFSHERMPGVVLNAHILNGLIKNNGIRQVPVAYSSLLSVIFILLSIAAIIFSPLRRGVVITGISITLILILSGILLAGWHLWFPPVVSILTVALIWPLWNIWQLGLESRLKQRLMRQLEHQSHHNVETGLPNDRLLQKQLSELGEIADENGRMFSLIIIHLDWHDSSSTIFGTDTGKKILKAFAGRLRSIVNEKNFIAHLHGDDFAVVLTDQQSSAEITADSQKLLDALHSPVELDKEKYLATPRLGVSSWPQDARDTNTLRRNAYTAMFKARMDDAQKPCLYSANVGQELRVRSQLERALVSALENNEMELHYQPQINARTGLVTGVEALLRWHNPKLGRVSPDNFIPVAEHVGLIQTIGDWVLETACWQLKIWQQSGYAPLRLSVNVSPLQFRLDGLNHSLMTIINRVGIQPEDLEIEITETSLVQNVKNTVKTMQQISQQGVKLVLDDFGTGYSSLSNLHQFPLDGLKIDKAFTREIGINNDATGIIVSVISMGKRLGLNIIAEGIETQQQADFLRQQGCDELQGYLYGRPVSAEDISNLLENEKQRTE